MRRAVNGRRRKVGRPVPIGPIEPELTPSAASQMPTTALDGAIAEAVKAKRIAASSAFWESVFAAKPERPQPASAPAPRSLDVEEWSDWLAAQSEVGKTAELVVEAISEIAGQILATALYEAGAEGRDKHA